MKGNAGAGGSNGLSGDFHPHNVITYDFDRWAYDIDWPHPPTTVPAAANQQQQHQQQQQSKLSNCSGQQFVGNMCSVVCEDIKFAFNAWCLLRVCLFYGTPRPLVLSKLTRSTPSMNISQRGNRMFYLNAHTGMGLGAVGNPKFAYGVPDLAPPFFFQTHSSVPEITDAAMPVMPPPVSIALTPSHPQAKSLYEFDWDDAFCNTDSDSASFPSSSPCCVQPLLSLPRGVQVVLGMENGMTDELVTQCSNALYIPQYGSIGSLSMMSALAVAMHHTFMHMWRLATPTQQLSSPTASLLPAASLTQPTSLKNPLASASQTTTTTVPATLPQPRPKRMPHCDELLDCSDDQVLDILDKARSSYKLQISVLWYNTCADRNIGATIRNANAFNCEQLIILNRKKYSKRGTVGTHHYTRVRHYYSLRECLEAQPGLLEEHAVWGLHCYFPYLQGPMQSGSECERRYNSLPRIFADEASSVGAAENRCSMLSALENVYSGQKKRGVLLLVPEEGAMLHESLVELCEAVVYQVNPNRFSQEHLETHQRGLTPQMATAVVMERLRHLIFHL